jgi:hypothetical protein
MLCTQEVEMDRRRCTSPRPSKSRAFFWTNGADINALDVDHESTPAQYMLRVEQKRHYPRDRQDVARYLVSRGCKTDILMAAALGDVNLVRQHLDKDPARIRMRVSDEWFPKQAKRTASGGSSAIRERESSGNVDRGQACSSIALFP